MQSIKIQLLKQGFQLKVDGTMYQKDKDAVEAIVSKYKGEYPRNSLGHQSMRAYVRCDDRSVTLAVDDNYPVKYHNDGSNGHTCEYYKVTSYLWNVQDGKAEELTERKLISEGQMIHAQSRLMQIEAEISKLQSERYPLQRLVGR